MCEVFLNNKCLGCNALESNVDAVKIFCDIYQDNIKGVTNDKNNNTNAYNTKKEQSTNIYK